jgi:spermidine/putrescine transport system permease protein
VNGAESLIRTLVELGVDCCFANPGTSEMHFVAALDRIDPSLIEAARDLGASPLRAFRRVTLPLSKQGILAGLVIIMLPMFGDYYTPDLLSGRAATRMIGNEISLLVHTGIGKSEGAALTLILMSFVALLMLYYLITVMRAQREAQR